MTARAGRISAVRRLSVNEFDTAAVNSGSAPPGNANLSVSPALTSPRPFSIRMDLMLRQAE